MTKIFESFRVFTFQSGVERMRDAYRTSMRAMEESYQSAKEASDRYEASGEDDSEYDDDNFLIHSTRHSLEYAAMSVGLAMGPVREAFITAAFHYWEASARDWTDLQTGRRFDTLLAAFEKDYVAHEGIGRLNTLNNYIKHRNPELAAPLLALDCGYLVPHFPTAEGKQPVLHLRITDQHVEEAFDIVWNSVPVPRPDVVNPRSAAHPTES